MTRALARKSEMSRRIQLAWAIVDRKGAIFMPVHYTRAAAIAHHVAWHLPTDEPQPKQFAFSGRLDARQRERWAWARKNGERAIRVTVSYPSAA